MPKDNETIRIYVGSRHVSLEISEYTIIARLLEGTFFDYKTVITSDAACKAVVNVSNMAQCVERASIIITDRLKSPVIAQFEGDRANITCKSSAGRVRDGVLTEYSGEPLTIGFNNKYMVDALKACKCDEVVFKMDGYMSPIRITPKKGDSFLFLVLPVRLNGKN